MKRLTAALALVWALIATATAQVTTNPDITGVGGGGCIAGSACTGTTITATTRFLAADGTAAAPSYSWTNGTGTGFYLESVADFGVSTGGVQRWRFGSGGQFAMSGTIGMGASYATTDIILSRYAAKQLMISGDGVGATTNSGWIIGYEGTNSGYSAMWSSNVTPTISNYALRVTGGDTSVGASVSGTAQVNLAPNNSVKLKVDSTAGYGASIIAGTSADNTQRALSISQGWTDGTTGNIGIVGNFDMGATGTATGKLLSLQAGAAGTTEVLSVNQAGQLTSGGLVSSIWQGQYWNTVDNSYTALENITANGNVKVHGVLHIGNVTTNGISQVSAGVIGVGTGAAGSTAGTLRAAALSANGSDFTITAANSVSPTSPNRTITISYGGTTYYLAAKTTND